MSNVTQTQPASTAETDLQTMPAAAETTETAGQTATQAAQDRASQPAPEVQDQPSYDTVEWPQDISFDAAQVARFKTLAQELKLSAEQVQKLVDLQTGFARENNTRQTEEKREVLARWAQQTKTLYGAKLDEEISYALRAADSFGGPDLRALLEDTGLGNHPVIIRTLAGIGRCISEDACPGGQPAAPQDKTFAEALYGKS